GMVSRSTSRVASAGTGRSLYTNSRPGFARGSLPVRMNATFLLYGANGYSGRLIAERARARNLRPILAGRNGAEIETIAKALDLPFRVFSLDDRASLEAALSEVLFVLHCAGPFSHTSAPMIAACLQTERHYLDITGEIGVFEAAAERDGEAKQKKVMLLP